MSKTIKIFSYSVFFVIVSISLTNCNAIFLPKHQTVKINTDSEENEIYLDNEFLCKGKSSTVKINNKTVKGDIVITRKGYKPIYDVIIKTRRPNGFYPLMILGLPTLHFGISLDRSLAKCKGYNNELNIDSHSKESLLPFRKLDDKFLDINNIKFDFKDITKDILYVETEHSDNLIPWLEDKEKQKLKINNALDVENKIKEIIKKMKMNLLKEGE
jgi:hypothetical protein